MLLFPRIMQTGHEKALNPARCGMMLLLLCKARTK